ncbi:MAG TPA: hypothetical protein VGG97_24120 [Bryobacteraceae bacterium]
MSEPKTLREFAHARSGDKGNISNIGVFVYREEDYVALVKYLTAGAVAAHFRGIVHGPVLRYELPKIVGLNFVMHHALGGGVTRSLALDTHGKCLSSLLLDMQLPDNFRPF